MSEITNMEVDLTNCDREPIHLAGAIQSHGCLLAFDSASLQLQHWSANAAEWTGIQPSPGTPLDAYFAAESSEQLRAVIREPHPLTHPMRLTLSNAAKEQRMSAIAHCYQGLLIVEFESTRTTEDRAQTLFSLPLLMARANHRLQACRTTTQLHSEIARQVRRISGFDRVMVYQFLDDGHGAVVGEDVDARFEPFLGLHYPATDVPAQARRLYLLNTVRSIADVNSHNVPMEPPLTPATGEPLDLSFCHFRAVSPIHIEYLQNMGVAASMSISIVAAGELWGLIACHHYSPRALSFEQRSACEVLGVMASSYLLTREQQAKNDLIASRQKLYAGVLNTIAESPSVHQGIEMAAQRMQKLVAADGVAMLWGEEVGIWGHSVSPDGVRQIVAQAQAGGVWSTNSLAESLPEVDLGDSGVCGCLLMPIQPDEGQYLMFFRREYAHEVSWAGDPHKPATQTEEGVRLSPRQSFALWKENVTGRSRQWSEADTEMATELRGGVIELLGRRAAELTRLNQELSRLNADLDSFAYAASHDLREPLRGVRQIVYFLRQELAEDNNQKAEPRLVALERQVARMSELIDGLLRLSRAGRGDLEVVPFTLEEVAREAYEMVVEPPHRETVVLQVDPAVTLRGDYICVRELLLNLTSNALKYNDNPKKTIEVGIAEPPGQGSKKPSQSVPVYYVRDNGIGIANEHLEEVFQIFRRLHAPDQYGGGSGAGLAIVKKVVERHGGRVWLESQVGTGTTVFFTLSPLQL
ncbi:ATP-binding protein [Aeoliella sp. ICT_H6.2]|uniref:histidine kinase n=2 Tax=Aeoliella straminimaris TaxID=2954799 RepID=A0A9X2JGA5_9BACT|nr:ATP-binding protein [Aeoliella straminimaris]